MVVHKNLAAVFWMVYICIVMLLFLLYVTSVYFMHGLDS